MTISGAVYREGVAFSPDGAMYVTPTGTASITGGTITGTNVPYVLARSNVGVSGAADTNENTLATISVPAGAMGANGVVRIWTQWSYTNGAGTKTMRIKFGGTNYMSIAATTTASYYDVRTISNRNATNSQVGFTTGSGIVSLSAGTSTTSAIDTTSAVTILITGQKTVGGDTITLESYLVEVMYSA